LEARDEGEFGTHPAEPDRQASLEGKREWELFREWISQAGSVEGERNPRGGGTGTPERRHRRGARREREWPEARSSRASARPGAVFKAEGKPTAGGSAKDARAQAERLERGEGGVSKPNERLRRAVKR
jgi:hypothetical protein